MEWKQYKRKTITEMRPWSQELDSVIAGTPGDMVARDPANHSDKWLITKDFFEKNYESIE